MLEQLRQRKDDTPWVPVSLLHGHDTSSIFDDIV